MLTNTQSSSTDNSITAVRNVLVHERSPEKLDMRATINAHQLAYGEDAVRNLSIAARNEIFGAGPLQKYLDDPRVTDVLVNDINDVWIDAGSGLQRVNCQFAGAEELRALAVRLAAQTGSRLDESSPSVDGRLADGTRLHALLHPICPGPAVLSLRTLRTTPLTLAQLEASQTINPEIRELLTAIISRRLNFLVSGATGTGKTTLLSTLLSYVPHNQRIITIEESREIQPHHPHVLALETKKPNVEGKGEVNQAELVRNALRMRPDRIVVGECRGAELAEMLMALNTGHEGGCGTIHANSAREVPARLHALGALAGMSPQTVREQASAAVDLVIHVRRDPGLVPHSSSSVRFVEEIGVLLTQDKQLTVLPALTWTQRTQLVQGTGYELLVRRLQE